MSWLKSSSFLIGSFGIWTRPKWLVTPRGAMASNSGCTLVLVDGATTANFFRYPSESTISLYLCLRRGRKPCDHLVAGHQVRVFLFHVEEIGVVRRHRTVADAVGN